VKLSKQTTETLRTTEKTEDALALHAARNGEFRIEEIISVISVVLSISVVNLAEV